MNWGIRLTSAKVEVGVEVEAELVLFYQYLCLDFTKQKKGYLLNIYKKSCLKMCEMEFLDCQKPRNSNKKSGNRFAGHPVYYTYPEFFICSIMLLVNASNFIKWLTLKNVQQVLESNGK